MEKTLQELATEIVERDRNIYKITQVLNTLARGRELPDYYLETYAILEPYFESGKSVGEIKAVFANTFNDWEARMSEAWQSTDTSKMTHKQFFETYGAKAFKEKYNVEPGSIGGQILITGEDPRERR